MRARWRLRVVPLVAAAIAARAAIACGDDTEARERAAYQAREAAKSARWTDTFTRIDEQKRASELAKLERETVDLRVDRVETERRLAALADSRDPELLASERRAQAAVGKRRAELDVELPKLRRAVAQDRERLLALRAATREALAHPKDGGGDEETLRARLAGVEKSLAAVEAALGEPPDGG